MAIEERDAFQLFQTLETLPEDMRPRAAGVLADYRNQQTAAGLPLWPSQEAARAEKRKRVYEVFDNPLTLDKEDGSFIQADRVQPGLGDTLRKREASIMWLANRYGADEMDVRNRLDLYKADASQKWGAGLLDDSAFFSRAKTEIDAERKKADAVKLASMTGMESSLWGGDGFAEASKFQASKPDISPDEQDAFWRSFNEFNAVLEPRRDMVKKATEAMRRMQQGEASEADRATMEKLTWTMTEATGKEREIMKRAVVLGARKVAEEGKRGVVGTFTGSASNLIESMFGSARRGERLAREFDPTQPQPVGPINSAQDALKAMDTMARAQFSEQVPYDPDAPALPEARLLTPDEQALFTQAKAKVKDLFKVERELKKIAFMTDPMDDSLLGTMASGTASTLTLALPLAMGPQGVLMAAGGYANMEKEELLTEYPDMQPEDAAKVAILSGGLQAAMDKAQLFGLGKFAPNVRKMLTEGMTKELVKRAVVQGGATFAFENIVEAAQDLTTPVVQQLVSDLSESVPGVDWQKEETEFWNSRLDVAIGMLPLMLIGAGANTAMDRDSVLALLSNDKALAEAGFVQDDRVAILDLASKGKVEDAQARLQEAMARRSPELAAEMGNEKEAEIINAEKVLQKAIDDGILPRARKAERAADGWVVEDTITGNIVKVPTREEAIKLAFGHLDEQEQRRAQAGAQLWDELYEKGGMGDEALRAESGSMDTQKQAAQSPEDAARVARGIETYAQLHGIPLDEARKIVFSVNGFNKDEQIENVRTAVSSVFGRGMNVSTVLHETTHGRWRAGLESGRFTHDQGLAWVRLAEQATGIDFLPSKVDSQISEELLDEAIVDVTVSDAIGRRKDGGKFSAGLISRGMAALARGERNTVLGKDIDSRKASREAGTFATWLKAWKEFWGQVIQKGRALRKAKAEGKLGEDYESFLDELMQASPQRRHDAAAAKEALEIAQAGNMAFSLSRAVPADASNIVQMPDGAQLVGPTSFSLQAYHGTPHKVDKFTTAKIGTGEGAQAYGWGLYFAENRQVGEQYQRELSESDILLDGEKVVASSAELQIAVTVLYGKSKDKAIAQLEDVQSRSPGEPISKALELIRSDRLQIVSRGNLYTVELLPDADEFLDWDKPLSEQSEKVKAALASTGLFTPRDLNPPANFIPSPLFNSGRGAYDILKSNEGSDKKASELLASLGIAGMKYFDGNSRNIEFGTRNYVIFDESLVKILEENGKPVSGASFSLAPKDTEYLAAVEAGDTAKAQEMVDEAAKAAGYDSPKLYHGTGAEFTSFDKKRGGSRTDAQSARLAIFFTDDEKTAGAYAVYAAEDGPVKDALKKAEAAEKRGDWDAYDQFIQEAESLENYDEVLKRRENAKVVSVYLRGDFLTFDAKGKTPQELSDGDIDKGITAQLKAAQRKGKTGVLFKNLDDAVNLSNRPSNHYAVFNPNQIKSADPVTRDESGQVIPLSQRFNPESPDIRFSLAPRSLPEVADTILAAQMKKPAFFEAFVTLARRKMDKLRKQVNMRARPAYVDQSAEIQAEIEAARVDYEADVAQLRQDRDFELAGARQEKSGKLTQEQIRRDFDGKIAQRQKEWTRQKASLDAKLAANDAAIDKDAAMAEKDRQMMALRTLDAILSAFPPEIRAKVGGFVKLASFSTDKAREAEITRRLAKLEEVIEDEAKKHYAAKIEKLFKRFAPKKEAGKKATGQLDPDAQELVDAARAAMGYDDTRTRAELAAIDSMLAEDGLTTEREVHLERQRELVQLFGDFDNAESTRLESAADALEDTATEGWAKWKLKKIMERERRTEAREALIKDTGKPSTGKERDKQNKWAKTTFGKSFSALLNVSSFAELLRFEFGEKSATARKLEDQERAAAYAYEDAMQAFGDRVGDFFAELAGGRLAGEQLRFDLAQPTLTVGTGDNERTISQLQGIQALLMWQQEDGRRHMEGAFDENGKPSGKWHYGEEWVKDLESKLSPEAYQVKSFLEQLYAEEYQPLNDIYRQRHGVNLPKNERYSPITVQPMQAKAGEMVDPVSGFAVTGSILTPGGLRTRNKRAVAEPRFDDAVQIFLGHSRQMEHWKAYYDFAMEAQAILLNREVTNAVEAKGSTQAVTVLKKWVDQFAQGGSRDAQSGLEISSVYSRASGRAARVALLGRISTLLIQSGQLAAASVKMPVGSYLKRLGMLLSGNLDYTAAVNSPFIQRRYKTAPPIVQQALAGVGDAKRPGALSSTTPRILGNLLSGADALFTGGTYAIILDYHRNVTGPAMGLQGAELEAFAQAEAERDTEAVAQPVRAGTRSIFENTLTSPLAKTGFAFASEARQKIALAAWSAYKVKSDPAQAAKVAFLTFIVGGLVTQVLKNLWREAKDDDDEKMWSAERLVKATIAGPLHGVPGVSELMGDPGLFSGLAWSMGGVKKIATKAMEDDLDEVTMRDVENALSAAGYFNDAAAGVAGLSHLGFDFAKILQALAEED